MNIVFALNNHSVEITRRRGGIEAERRFGVGLYCNYTKRNFSTSVGIIQNRLNFHFTNALDGWFRVFMIISPNYFP